MNTGLPERHHYRIFLKRNSDVDGEAGMQRNFLPEEVDSSPRKLM
jgi:hypothetical protein